MRIYYDREQMTEAVFIQSYGSYSQKGTPVLFIKEEYNAQRDFTEFENDLAGTYNWFFITYIDKNGRESAFSNPVLRDDIASIVDSVRESLNDVNQNDPAFKDEEYWLKIREANRRIRGTETIAGLKDSDISILMILVKGSCAQDLAYDSAKYTKIQLPEGLILNKGDRVNYYLKIAEACERQFNSIMGTLKNESGALFDTPTLEVLEAHTDDVFKHYGRYSKRGVIRTIQERMACLS